MASSSPTAIGKVAPLSENTTENRKPSRPASFHRKISDKRLFGRLPVMPNSTSPIPTNPRDTPPQKPFPLDDITGNQEYFDAWRSAPGHEQHLPSSRGVTTRDHGAELAEQVKEWLYKEKQRQKDRRERKRSAKEAIYQALHMPHQSAEGELIDGGDVPGSPASSGDEESQDSLNRLEDIVTAALITPFAAPSRRQSASGRRGFSGRRSRARSLMGNTSDTDYASDGEPVVPVCEVYLQTVEEVGVEEFKRQVLTLAHTLRVKGWRRVPLDRFKDISVERISGALTNAVYMVSPPQDISASYLATDGANDSRVSVTSTGSTKSLERLLLRIYGPQVSHLIDRETELSILRRLARKRIGPRLLGTFENGRFEEFFNAKTLTRDDIRVPETSRHIAKRLKELHEGIELEERERRMGPISWCNWYKWAPRTRGIMAFLDATKNLNKKGFIVGCPWEKFEAAVERYKEWLYARYGSEDNLRKQMVFSHNDTQYGNIMRLQASGKSPLLIPSNEHRQLVVIDFEYASANTPGFELANHFCEWMSNYHDPVAPYFMHHSQFPTSQEQRNFLRAYVEHSLSSSYGGRSISTPATGSEPSASPALRPSIRSSISMPSFMLDARTPGASYNEEEAARQRGIDEEVERLEGEARAWRAASHAMWCAWGIVQAKIPGAELEAALHGQQNSTDSPVSEEANVAASELENKRPEEEGDEDEFDYLGYAQQRALLFWGDMLALGIMMPEEVGPEIVEKAKIVAW